MKSTDVLSYINNKFNENIEYPFKDGETGIVRHRQNKKWYAVFMNVKKNKFGINSSEKTEVLNLKCDPNLINELINKKGFYRAYHMNKVHWISVVLEEVDDFLQVFSLVNFSFELTK